MRWTIVDHRFRGVEFASDDGPQQALATRDKSLEFHRTEAHVRIATIQQASGVRALPALGARSFGDRSVQSFARSANALLMCYSGCNVIAPIRMILFD